MCVALVGNTRLAYKITSLNLNHASDSPQCDGLKPACSQCRLIGRECQGYSQDLQVVFHNKPTARRPRPERTTDSHRRRNAEQSKVSSLVTDPSTVDQPQLSYDECVAMLVEYYIPKEERPFLLSVEPSKSRICGGWVQALAHVNKDHVDFESIVLPAVRAFTMSMMVTGTSKQQEYLDTYGNALQGIRSVLDGYSGPVGSTVAIAGMCLALSEARVPTSQHGYNAHLRGVAAMMQSRDPNAFKEGVAHLMFAGVRPLMVIDAVIRRKSTFLMDKSWQNLPFAVHRASRIQILLSHATAIPPLLEAMDTDPVDTQTNRASFLKILEELHNWEDSFVADNMLHQSVDPVHFGLPVDPLLLPNLCLSFLDVSHANCLSHCWAFRVVCLTELARLESSKAGCTASALGAEFDRRAKIQDLGYKICRALPFFLQKDMSLYGSMSAGYPLYVVSESLRILQLEDRHLTTWCTTIKEHIQNKSIILYKDMAISAST